MKDHPPRLARWLAGFAAGPAERPWLLSDLDEMFAHRQARDGRRRARRWYWLQAVRCIPHLLPTRFDILGYHLRHAFRRLFHEPAFTCTAVLTLALGVGGNVAVFAVVDAVLLRPLPYPAADRLVVLKHRDQRSGITKEFVPVGDAVDLVKRQSAFDALGTYSVTQMTVSGAGGSGDAQRAHVLLADPAALAALGFRPSLGRSFDASDGRSAAPTTVILGWEFWQKQFGGDPRVLGRSVSVDDKTVTIVGVAPRGFRVRSTASMDVLLPAALPVQAPAQRDADWAFLIGRLKQGVTLGGAAADLAKISSQLQREFPESNQAASYVAVPLRDILVGDTRPALLLLLAAVGVVLLIACVNIANLLLARSLARRREMAVRIALGAGRSRLAMQLVSENLVIAFVAATLGTAFAYWGAHALAALVPQSVQVPMLEDVRIDGRVLAFALALTIVTTLVFGFVAMMTVKLDDAAAALVGAGRLSPTARMRHAASALVVAEVALASVLLIGGGLVLRTLDHLLSVNPGFRYDNILTMSVLLPPGPYRDLALPAARDDYFRSAFARIRALPGVRDVGAAVVVPLTGNNWTTPFERLEQPTRPGERAPDVGFQSASAGFFTSLGIPLIAGRLFDARERPGSPPVVIISEAAAKQFFGAERAVGHRVRTEGSVAEIVGVVGDIRRAGLREAPRPDLYLPFERFPSWSANIFVRTADDPMRVASSVQAGLRSVDAKVVVDEVQSLADVAVESVRTTQLVLWLLGAFSLGALGLAAVGIYGVMSYVVRQRTREIGTRIAFGATRLDIMWLVMREATVIAAAGCAIGLFIGLIVARTLGSLLYGVAPWDPAAITSASAVLIAAVYGACYLPARRAASVDPVRALAD